MARKFRPEDLTLVPCNCASDQSIGGEARETEWHEHPKAAARAVKGHVELGHVHWGVHWAGAEGDQQVVSAVLDGLPWGPGPPGR